MNVSKPQTIDDAVLFLTEHPDAKIVAGGTDLLPRINQKLEEHAELCYIDDLPEMCEVRAEQDGSIFVGASIRLAEVAEIKILTKYTGFLQAASKVASPQIRNQATIGGNILQENRCMYFNNQVPWSDVNHCFKWGGKQCFQYKNSKECVALFQSDVAPVLISFGAKAVIRGSEGIREMPVKDLYMQAGLKNLAHNDILLGVKLPPLFKTEYSAYVRKTIRGSFDFPLVSCAVRVCVDANIIKDSRVVFGAAGVMPAELHMSNEVFIGRKIEDLPLLADELQPAVSKIIAPFQDTRINAAVRKDMAKEIFIKAIAQICQGN
ncbi:MAG: FAD binding domain-containing protein [Desulfitobacteriaceae bacterium]|nr:FAD binding domain-containing protein [Desulfitobacteriaceae bacterium]